APEVRLADRRCGVDSPYDQPGLRLVSLRFAVGEGDLGLDDLFVDRLADRADDALQLLVVDVKRWVGWVVAEKQAGHHAGIPAAMATGLVDRAVEVEGETRVLGLDVELLLAVAELDLVVDVRRERFVHRRPRVRR